MSCLYTISIVKKKSPIHLKNKRLLHILIVKKVTHLYILQGEDNMKKVKCVETQVIYNSAREAGKELNISYKAISKI